MKVTALISDDLINEVKKATGGKNITESLIIALKGYLSNQKINQIIDEIDREPLMFQEGFEPYGMRTLNRNR